MKHLISLFLIFVAACSNSNSSTAPDVKASPMLESNNGDRVGNGGGVWVCQNPDKSYRWIELVDLFEARNEFQVETVMPEGFYKDLFNYRRWALAKSNPILYKELHPYLRKVMQNHSFIKSELQKIDDVLYRVQPGAKDCDGGQVEFKQLANFTNYNHIIINEDLWNNAVFSEGQKAALLFHEAVYYWLRDKAKDHNSVRARAITGFLFSTLYKADMNNAIEEVLTKWGKDPRSDVTQKSFAEFGLQRTGQIIALKSQWEKGDSLLRYSDVPNDPIYQFRDQSMVLSRQVYTLFGVRFEKPLDFEFELKRKNPLSNIWSYQGFRKFKLASGAECEFMVEVLFVANGVENSELWMKWPYVINQQDRYRKPMKCDDLQVRSFFGNESAVQYR